MTAARDGVPPVCNFLYRYTFHSRSREMGLGSYPGVSLADAREKARAAATLRDKGLDPLGEAQKAKASAPNLADLRAERPPLPDPPHRRAG